MKRLIAPLVGVGLALVLPAVVAAHPLGNFTINHYAGLRIGTDRIAVDVVMDQAEIPTFQESTRIDTDGDGVLSTAEIEAERVIACPRLAAGLSLSVGGSDVALIPTAAGLSFPIGASGAATMRLVCEFDAVPAAPIGASTQVRFEDTNDADRIGWREIVVQGDGTRVDSTLPTSSISQRLTVYPTNLLSQPLNVRSAAVAAAAGGAPLAAWAAPDATPLTAAGAGSPAAPGSAATPAASAAPAAVPGGVAGEISGLLGATDLTPVVLALSFLTAVLLGAGHALTPGHGKTIMAAFLVGTKGTTRHAMGLGLATAVSHTIGVLTLALLIVAAGSALPADRVYPVLSAVSGVIVVIVGAWLVATQLTRWLRSSRRNAMTALPATASMGIGGAGAGVSTQAHSHPTDEQSLAVAYGGRHALPSSGALGAPTSMALPARTAGRPAPDAAAGLHRHGWRVHSHVPTSATGEPSLSWRSLFALGLSGGLVPSTNALLILIATVAAGRAAYGIVLVVAFGIGMAAVLVGVGLALVYASGIVASGPRNPLFQRLVAFAPAAAAFAVLALGIYLTTQALSGSPVF